MHFYEKNIVEIKNEYTTFLVNIMTPFIYEGLKSVYNYALEADDQFKSKARNDPSVQSPGILKIFQTCLREIPSLNNHSIENETNRIKDKSKCSDWFDDLVKAVIKSNIVLLTFSTDKNQSDLLNEKFHERIQTKDFVHKCLIEAARAVYNNPELFWHDYPAIEVKRNQREICELIKEAIKEAIRKMLPMKLILKEYLQNEYVKETFSDVNRKITDSQYMNVKAMVKRDLYGNDKFNRLEGSLLEDDSDNEDENNEGILVENEEAILDDAIINNDDNMNGFEALRDSDRSNQSQRSNKSKSAEKIDDDLYKDLNDLNNELRNIENNMNANDNIIEDDMNKEHHQKVNQEEGHTNTPFIKQNPKDIIKRELDDYLKQSEEHNSSAKLQEINTEIRNNATETDRSQFFARYNV